MDVWVEVSSKVSSLALTADLHFEFGDPALKSEQLLLEGGFFTLE